MGFLLQLEELLYDTKHSTAYVSTNLLTCVNHGVMGPSRSGGTYRSRGTFPTFVNIQYVLHTFVY